MSKKTTYISAFVLLPAIALIYGLFTKQYDICLNSLLTIGVILAFVIVHKKISVFSPGVYYAILAFILLSVFGGRTLGLYTIIPRWDKILHFASGLVIAPAGMQIFDKANGDKDNLLLKYMFAVFFSIAVAGLWEIWEFSGDTFLGTNSQNNSLNDTMTDIIMGTVSGIISVILYHFFSKKK